MADKQRSIERFFRPKRERETDEDQASQVSVAKKQLIVNTEMESRQVGQITVAELKEMMSQTINAVIDQRNLATREDLDSLRTEVQTLKLNVEILEKENKKMRDGMGILNSHIETIDIKARKVNVIIGGLDPGANATDSARTFIKDVLKLNSAADGLKRAYSLGKARNSPMLAEFVDRGNVEEVLRNSSMLRGTGFYVQPDLPPSTRNKKNKLLRIKKELFQKAPNLNVTLRTDILLVDGLSYMWDAEKGLVDREGRDGVAEIGSRFKIDLTATVDVLRANQPPKSPSIKNK